MRFSGTTVLKVENGLITEEIGLDDGVSALQQLGLVRSDGSRSTCEPARIQHHRSGSATLCRADLTFVALPSCGGGEGRAGVSLAAG